MIYYRTHKNLQIVQRVANTKFINLIILLYHTDTESYIVMPLMIDILPLFFCFSSYPF